MLGDGYWPGASTLIAGPSGAGKTVMALSFIFEGARRGEQGLIANLQENPSQLERTVRGFGWSLDNDHVELMYRSSVDLYIDEWVHELLERVAACGATRLVIDSLGDLAFASPDNVRFREYVYSLVQRCSRSGISLLMTMEIPDLFDVRQLSESGVSNMSDNVVLLQFVRRETKVKRSVTVLKTRAALHEPEIREYIIDKSGIVLADPID
jgi:circadian clock protein KaiC